MKTVNCDKLIRNRQIRNSAKIEDFIEARFQVVHKKIDAMAHEMHRQNMMDYCRAIYENMQSAARRGRILCPECGDAPTIWEKDYVYCDYCNEEGTAEGWAHEATH